MKKIILILAVICVTAITSIGFVSCNNNSAPVVSIAVTPKTTIAQYKGTAEGATDVIKIHSDGTWQEIWSGNGSIPTSGVYTVLSGNETNGSIEITVTYSTVTSVPVGTKTTITITDGKFTFNGIRYTKF